jgi:hypothetical protein
MRVKIKLEFSMQSVDSSSHFEKSIFARKILQGLTRPPCNVFVI